MTALDRPVERRDGPVWVGTSWKMTKTLAEARTFVDRIAGEVVPAGIQPFVIPPHTALAAVRERLPVDSPVLLGAQNAHWAPEGAWTGEISMAMAADAGARLIEIGHSERRLHFGETDETVAAKTAAALRHDLIPLVCVGEPAEVRDAGRAASFIADQVLAALARVPTTDVGRVLLAYEPIWAIGQAGRAARPEEVSPVLREIVSVVAQLTSGQQVRALLYGGSVHPDNAAALLADPCADGVFVGRSAWQAEGFLTLWGVAEEARQAKRSSV